MSEVRRYSLGVERRGREINCAVLNKTDDGEWVRFNDYVAMKVERDKLAQATVKGHCWREFFDEHRPKGATHYCTACRGLAWDLDGEGDEDGVFDAHHEPDCPLALAEEILKETPNER